MEIYSIEMASIIILMNWLTAPEMLRVDFLYGGNVVIAVDKMKHTQA